MPDREKVIKELQELHGSQETMKLIADAIALLEEQEQKWISVEDRLPEIRHAVLAYSPFHKNIWAVSMHDDGEWYYWIPSAKKYDPDWEGPITHWMPMPKIPHDQKVNGMEALNQKEICEQLEEVENIVENEVHPVVSPDNWYVYSSLHDELEQLKILLKHNNVI